MQIYIYIFGLLIAALRSHHAYSGAATHVTASRVPVGDSTAKQQAYGALLVVRFLLVPRSRAAIGRA